MKPKRIVIALENTVKDVAAMSARIEDFVLGHGLSRRMAFQISLVLDELVTNAVSYGYIDQEKHDIIISLDLDEEGVHIHLQDDAGAFNPLNAPEPDLDLEIEKREAPYGGLGIHIVKSLVDSITYERKDEKNILKMYKKFCTDCDDCF
jgi:anti-sigma regulatory factor (Ser/Thr protein kinase)